MTTDIPPWDPEAFDRRILRERTVQRHAGERMSPSPPSSNGTTASYTDRSTPRGVLNDEELQRRKQAERAMQARTRYEANRTERNERRRTTRPSRATGAPRKRPWPLPPPKRQPNGRWLARVVHQRQVYQRTFDTKRQARDFINRVVNGDS